MKWKHDRSNKLWFTEDEKWFISVDNGLYELTRSFKHYVATFKLLRNAKKVAELIEEG